MQTARNVTFDHIIAEIARREGARRSLATYAQHTLELTPAAHHVLIYNALESLINDEYDDLIVNTPPGSAKSTLVSHVFPSWFIGNHPEKNVIIASHTASLAEKWSRRVRDTVASDYHQMIFEGASALSKDSTAVSRWTTTKNGEVLAAGAGMSILGFRADVVVMDDVVSGWEQANSITQLQKLHEWYKSDVKSRMKPHAKVVLICQRLSVNDMAGFMIAEHAAAPTRRLRVLSLPMVAKDENDPLGRTVGERLWPEWYTEEMVEDLRKDDLIWRTMWQQEPPSDSGSWVSTEEIQFRPSPATPEVLYGATDIALSVNTGDYTVHIVVAVNSTGEWDIIEAHRARVDPSSSADKLVSLCSTYKVREWLIDDDNASKVFMPLVATKARQLGVSVPWKPMPLRGQDKETRAAPLRGQFKRRKIFMPSDAHFTGWLTKELLVFPNAVGSGVDDGVDTLSLFGRRMLAITGPETIIAPKAALTVQDMTLDDLWADKKASSSSYRRM